MHTFGKCAVKGHWDPKYVSMFVMIFVVTNVDDGFELYVLPVSLVNIGLATWIRIKTKFRRFKYSVAYHTIQMLSPTVKGWLEEHRGECIF
jgi:hypothetical protein